MAMLNDDFQLFEHSSCKSQFIKSFSTRCKTRNGIVYKCTEDMEDKLKYFEDIILGYRHRSTRNFKEKIELFSDVIGEIEEIVLSTNIRILHKYFLFSNITHHKTASTLFCLITYHLLNTSGRENLENLLILNLIRNNLRRLRSEFYLPLQVSKEWEKTLCVYLDVYYNENENENFANIHAVWNSYPFMEHCLQLISCKQSMENNHHTTLVQLIHTNTDYFIKSYEVESAITCEVPDMAIMVMLHILNHQISLHRTEKVKTIESILTSITKAFGIKDKLLDGFANFILTLENKQLLCIPYIIESLQPFLMQCDESVILKILVLCRMKLNQANYNKEGINFIKRYSQFFLSVPTNDLMLLDCEYKQQYCITMLILLDGYTSCHDSFNMNLVLIRLLVFRVALLSNKLSSSCCCFMGKQECKKFKTVKAKESETLSSIDIPITVCFRQEFMLQYSKLSRNMCSTEMKDMFSPKEFDSVMENVVHGKWKLAPYLGSFVYLMSVNDYKVESFLSFKEFLKRAVVYDADILYDIIKMFSAFDGPEIQDMILQGIIDVLMICNVQFVRPSKLILDINRICPQGQFLQKLTTSIAKSFLHFNENSEYDFKVIIYQCYCTVRHESKNEKEVNIARYKEYFTFIASMEVDEEIKKIAELTNLLLMLTLLQIASGGHHKSAELKKYLSLKYEYRDSILYLLWCSGDIEINPGPTLCTMRKLQNSEKERNWIYEMCSILLRLLKYKSIYIKNSGLWKEKPLHWPTEWPFYDPRNKPKGRGYNNGTDKTLLNNLEELFNIEVISKDITKFDEPTKSKLGEYKKELTAWKNNRTELFELYTLRQELDTLKEAKGFLHKYRKDPEFHQNLYDLNVELMFNSTEYSNIRQDGYTDIVRDIAITFCRIGKGLSPLEKSDGIWKTQPLGWNPNHSFFSPCNAGKRKEKGQDKKLVDNLLTYCESKNQAIPSELQPLIKAWKERNKSEITKYYSIWSKIAIIKHSLKYLELEDMLGKIHVNESLRRIGVILDTQCWRCPSGEASCTSDNGDKHHNSGFSNNLHSSPSSDIETNSTAKLASLQINSDNQSIQFTDSTQTNLIDTPASSHSLVSHTDDHLCNVAPDQQHQRNQSSKRTCVNSFKDSRPILTKRAQSEADVIHHPISSVNSSNSKREVIPSIVVIHDATSKPVGNKNKPKTAKKRKKQNNDESPSEPKQLCVSEEDVPLLLNLLISPSENGKVLKNTRRKDCSKDGDIRTISPYQFPHDLISIQSRLNPLPAKKQTDQLVVKDLPNIAPDKPEESSISNKKDGEINNANKNKTTSDQYVDKIVDLLEELDQEYSSTLVERTIPISCSSTDQSSDSSDELPEPIKLCVDTYLNSYNPDDKLETDIEQFIEEQGMDSS